MCTKTKTFKLYFQRLSQEADEREDEDRAGEENKTKAKSELKVE